MDGVRAKYREVRNEGLLPAQLEVGTIYFVMDKGLIVINHGDVTARYAGAAVYVADSLGGGEREKAPSVGAVEKALDGKADLIAGKILVSQLPSTMTLYRGIFATDAQLQAAWPADMPGAYATVVSTKTVWFWDGGAWTDTGSLGAAAVQTINGLLGPDVTLTWNEVGAAPASHADDGSLHLGGGQRDLLDQLAGELAALTEPSLIGWDPGTGKVTAVPLSKFLTRVPTLLGGDAQTEAGATLWGGDTQTGDAEILSGGGSKERA